MFCPSCENLMSEDSHYCGKCGMFLSKGSERIIHLGMDFGWIWRRSFGGFSSGFIGWIMVFIIMRMVKPDLGPVVSSLFAGIICGVFLGTVGGIIEESGYKAFVGGLLGAIGGGLGGILTLPLMSLFQGNERLYHLVVLITWAIGGLFIGAASGAIEKSRNKILAGMLFGLIGGGLGGFLGINFFGSVHAEFSLKSWISGRLAEGFYGGLVGAVLWFFIGFIEKVYIFKRREGLKNDKKICEACGKANLMYYWYCVACGKVLQMAAPRQKIRVTPYRGIERSINALKFMSWLFGVTGVIITPFILIIFLFQDVLLAFISVTFFILFSYFMVVGFRFSADLLSGFVSVASQKTESKVE
jgi:hypothetical protein